MKAPVFKVSPVGIPPFPESPPCPVGVGCAVGICEGDALFALSALQEFVITSRAGIPAESHPQEATQPVYTD